MTDTNLMCYYWLLYKDNKKGVRLQFNLSSQRILVFPAASRPNIKILISLLPNILDNSFPMMTIWQNLQWEKHNSPAISESTARCYLMLSICSLKKNTFELPFLTLAYIYLLSPLYFAMLILVY